MLAEIVEQGTHAALTARHLPRAVRIWIIRQNHTIASASRLDTDGGHDFTGTDDDGKNSFPVFESFGLSIRMSCTTAHPPVPNRK